MTIAINFICELFVMMILYSADPDLQTPIGITVGEGICGEALHEYKKWWVRLSNYIKLMLLR